MKKDKITLICAIIIEIILFFLLVGLIFMLIASKTNLYIRTDYSENYVEFKCDKDFLMHIKEDGTYLLNCEEYK